MANYERLSPGVYRGPNGALVHKGGRPINPQEARQMQGGRQVQMKPQPMGLPPQQQFDGMQYATRQDFNAGQAPMDEMGMSGHQFGSMRNQMGPSGAPPGAGSSGGFAMNSFDMNPQPLAQGNGAPPPTGGPATMPQGGQRPQRPQRPQVTAGERLSPGVYRGSDGSLVGKNGRPLPSQGGGGQGGGQQEPASPWMGDRMPAGTVGPNDPRRWGGASGGDNNAISREQFDQIMPGAYDQMQGSGRGLPRPIRGNGQGGAFPGRKTAGVAGMPPKGRGRY